MLPLLLVASAAFSQEPQDLTIGTAAEREIRGGETHA
jgi:hypothetical protein